MGVLWSSCVGEQETAGYVTDRPQAGQVRATDVVDFDEAPFQRDADPFTDRPEPRNSRRGDPLQNVDLRLTKIVRLGATVRASVFWEMFNVLNTVNFTTYEGSLESANFGLPLAALPMRRQQVGVRLEF